jgi:hypothetical protein
MITLSEHQKKVIDYPSSKMVVSLGVGLGKTIATLSAHSDVKNILIVMPKMLKEDKTWEKNQEKIGTNSVLYTISKENFRKHHKTLPYFDCVILDEYASWAVGVSPTMRSKRGVEYISESQIHTAIMWYINTHKPSRIYLVDATASANKPMALWATMRILGKINPNMRVIDSFKSFRNIFYFKVQKGYTALYMQKKDKKTAELLSEYWRKTGVFLDDENRIPPIEEIVPIEITQKQKEYMLQIKREYTNPLTLNLKEYMCLNGVHNSTIFNESDHTSQEIQESIYNHKITFIKDYATSHKKQFIVFATFKVQINEIVKTLKDKGITAESITGNTKDKSVIADKFRNNELQVLVVQSSICQGWEAPYCDTIIRASMPNRADHAIQQAGRIDRPHIISKQNYIYNLIIKGTVDEKAYKTIKAGGDIHWLTVNE